MQLIEIDVVGAQPTQRVLDSATDVATSSARLPVRTVQGVTELRREHEVVAVTAQELAQEVLGLAVDVGGVDKGDAFVYGGVDDCASGIEIDAAAEVVSAQSDSRDHETGVAQPPVLHVL